MAVELGISFASVTWIRRKRKIRPHRIETFKFSIDPDLEPKIRDVTGLYLDPPANAVVVSVDETVPGAGSGPDRSDAATAVRLATRKR